MRTRAQLSRDAALRRLTRVNHALAVAAVIAVGVITDIVANTASGHTRGGSQPNASGGNSAARAAPARHH
ncbi:MAG: hypothetical protein KGL16_06230, partial [Acidobacteriota bacterium]|nr:hypothetical protein [Acidobacteriota bacterium]